MERAWPSDFQALHADFVPLADTIEYQEMLLRNPFSEIGEHSWTKRFIHFELVGGKTCMEICMCYCLGLVLGLVLQDKVELRADWSWVIYNSSCLGVTG